MVKLIKKAMLLKEKINQPISLKLNFRFHYTIRNCKLRALKILNLWLILHFQKTNISSPIFNHRETLNLKLVQKTLTLIDVPLFMTNATFRARELRSVTVFQTGPVEKLRVLEYPMVRRLLSIILRNSRDRRLLLQMMFHVFQICNSMF